MQSAPRKSHAERTDLSDKLMLKAAIDLIVNKGPDKTTLKEIGELAGYSRGLAGYRFGSRDGFFEFAIRSIGESWLNELTKVTKDKVGVSAINTATDTHFRMCEENPKHVRAFYILWFDAIGSEDSSMRSVVLGIQKRRNDDVINWIKKDASLEAVHNKADAVAELFNASISGIAYHWLMNPEDMRTIKRLHENLNTSIKLMLSP